MSEAIKEVARRRIRVVKHETQLKAAQRLLWKAVAAAHREGAPLDDIVAAAGWRTKKSVYDAIERVEEGS